MPRLTPSDLANAVFTRAPLGYKHDEVNDLVDAAALALEELTAENDDLRAQALRLRGELEGARGEERLLKEALLSAQRAAELLRADAVREAEAIREEARRQALADRTQAQREAEALQADVGRLQTLRARLLTESRALLERLGRELDALAPAPPVPAPTALPPCDPAPEEPPTQTYPTRLPKRTRPLKPVEPVVVEDEHGEKWVT